MSLVAGKSDSTGRRSVRGGVWSSSVRPTDEIGAEPEEENFTQQKKRENRKIMKAVEEKKM